MSKEPRGARSRTPVFVDTDAGCDDALAVVWLLRHPAAQIVGMSSVFGNSSVQNTTANLLTVLEALDDDTPVTMGASAPLVYPRTGAGAISHGPDGLWGAQAPANLAPIAKGAPGAIAAAARAHPGLTVLALGPLTNVARAVQAYPDEMANVRLVALAGARIAGNLTPVAEFNVFADPHALAVVLESQMQVELITRDAFEDMRIDGVRTATQLERECGPVGQVLAQALLGYTRVASRGVGNMVAVPDVTAVIYALHPRLGVAAPATVRVVTEGELTRGQTIVALSQHHQAALALGHHGVEQLASEVGAVGFNYEAALEAACARAPHNARVVLQIDAPAMSELFKVGLMELGVARAVGE